VTSKATGDVPAWEVLEAIREILSISKFGGGLSAADSFSALNRA